MNGRFTPLLLTCTLAATALGQVPDGPVSLRRKAGPSEIVVTTTPRVAGAVHSLTWNGKEFIDSFDHGRQMQSACSFDAGVASPPGGYDAEAYNPTEAGSRDDNTGPKSSSRLLRYRAGPSEWETATRMAFWVAPGAKTERGTPAVNTQVLSDHVVTRRLRLGVDDLPHALECRVTFTVPPGERHMFAQFEALTGYMPYEFRRFWKLDPSAGLVPLSDGPGEQELPVVLATADGAHAMGVYSPESSPGYGRWRFAHHRVVKWNCVFRVRMPKGISPGDYSYRVYVAVGSLENVRATLAALTARKGR